MFIEIERGYQFGFLPTEVREALMNGIGWISRYNGPANLGDAACCVAVSPVGTTVFVTGSACDLTTGIDYATVAYRV